ncbi:unnamed protein product [Pylaiella littoralis]
MRSSGGSDKRPSRVLEHLFIGSRAHAKNRGLLQDLGINRILNVTPARTMDPTNGVPNFFEKDRSMTYKRVAVFDNRGEDLLQHLESCISFIEQGSFYGKVLVHCNKGVSRSSTVVAAYLMRTRGLSKAAAMSYLRSRRSIVNPHEGFIAQLEAFEAKLEGEWEAAIADGQAKKFPDDLLDTAGRTKAAAQGPAIGPIGPSRGPSAAKTAPAQTTPGKNASGNSSPTRRPTVGPSPPRTSAATCGGRVGPARSGGTSPSPPRNRTGPIGPPRGPAPQPQVPDPVVAAATAAAAAGGGGGGGGSNGGAREADAAGAGVDGTAAEGPSSAVGEGSSCQPGKEPPGAPSRSSFSVRREDADDQNGGVAAAAAAATASTSNAEGASSRTVGSKERKESNVVAAVVADQNAAAAAATENCPASVLPAAGANASASSSSAAAAAAAIGPAIGPSARLIVGPEASGNTPSLGGGEEANMEGGVGAEGAGGRSRGRSSGGAADVGGKRVRDNAPTAPSEAVVKQKPRLATGRGAEDESR